MKYNPSRFLTRAAMAFLAVGALATTAKATPYASCFTNNFTNNIGVVTFYLNETNNGPGATTTVTLSNPSSGAGTNYVFSLGGLLPGLHSFNNYTVAGTNTVFFTNYSVSIFKPGTAFSQISQTSSATYTATDFDGPRGITVNRNPQRKNFGRIYVSEGATGAGNHRPITQGMFVLNSDFSDADGYGTNGQFHSLIGWGSSTSYAPGKSFVGIDDKVYFTDQNGPGPGGTEGTSGVVGTLFMADPDLLSASVILVHSETNSSATYSGSPTNVGVFSSTPWVSGSLAQGNLVVEGIQWGYALAITNPLLTQVWAPSANTGGLTTEPSYNAIWRYNLSGITSTNSLPYFGFPTPLYPFVGATTNYPIEDAGDTPIFSFDGNGSAPVDIAKGPNGYYYSMLGRAGGTTTGAAGNDAGAANGTSCLWVFDATGSNYLWDSSSAAGDTNSNDTLNKIIDPFNSCYAFSVSPDGLYLAALQGNVAGSIITVSLTNGIPDLSSIKTNTSFTAGASTHVGLAFDAADNIYVADGGADFVGAYSLGLTTTATTANDITLTNGSFSLTFPATTVSVAATANQASQGGSNGSGGTPVPGTFTITRVGSIGSPLAVSFTLTGSASNAEYTASGGYTSTNGSGQLVTNTITIAAGQVSTNITITPINDGVPRLTNTVVLTILGSANYGPGTVISDTVYIQNTAAQQLTFTTGGAATMYKAYSNDVATVVIERLGDTTVANYTVGASSFTYPGGTAVLNTDYTPFGPIVITNGLVYFTNSISPLVNGALPTHAPIPYTGNKTIVAGLVGGTDSGTGISYTGLGTTTLTSIDYVYPAAPLLYSNALTSAADAANWHSCFANGNLAGVGTNGEYEVDFGFDLTGGGSGTLNDAYGNYIGTSIPLPPSGATTALRVTVNKNSSVTSSQDPQGAMNLYPIGVSFSNNYALRFQMNLIQGGNLPSATEGVLFGINHNGLETNWWSGSTIADTNTYPYWAADGVWFWQSADAGGASLGDYLGFTGNGLVATNQGYAFTKSGLFYSSFPNKFKGPEPFSAYNTTLSTSSSPVPESGLPANGSSEYNYYSINSLPGGSGYDSAWADVEVKQINNVITWSVNKTPIMTYTNTVAGTSLSTNGTFMLGYEDPFASIGSHDASVYFSSVYVVQLGPPVITGISATNSGSTTTTVITFTSSDGDDSTSSFSLQSTASALTPFANVSPAATITQNPSTGVYTATTTSTGSTELYRIVHN